MAEPKTNELMEKIVSLCKRRGFIFQSSEIYGGINGFWDYGPLGAELKRNVKELWWNSMTRQREDVVGLEATIIMAPQIWRASGHVDTFCDPMCDCLVTGKRFRADQVDAQTGWVIECAGAVDLASFLKLVSEREEPERSTIWSRADLAPLLRVLFENQGGAWGENYRGGLLQLSGNLEAQKAAFDLLVKEKAFQTASTQSFSAMQIDGDLNGFQWHGKGLNPAVKTAQEFYRKRGINNPIVIVAGLRKEQDSLRFNPENGSLLTEPRPFNLMFKTYVGPVESEDNVAYLRPETAQAIFAQFKNVFETSRQKIPFGIAQVGKAFRNEVTPRNYTFRSREFEQMELEFFIKPDEAIEAIHGSVATVPATGHPGEPQPNWGWQAWHQYWVEERVRFYEGIGLSRQTLGFHVQTPEELAHYARATVDILYKFPFSKRDENGELKGEELEGIAARSDFDLSQHERFSGKQMGVFDDELRGAWSKLDDAKKQELSKRYYESRLKYLTKMGVDQAVAEKQAKANSEALAKGNYIPHVIEPSAGVDRLILALISNAYSEVMETDEKGKSETRVVMRFHSRVAPIKVAIFPLLKNKPELVKKAREIRELLRPHMNVFYDDGGSIGRRYARQDEAGTPFGITVDFETLGEKPELLDTVTLRERDTMQQTRVKISDLLPLLLEKIR